MAQATIRVKMDFTFDIMHETEDEDQLLGFVHNSKELRSKVLEKAQEEFQIEEATYEEPEPEEVDEESDADN